MKTTYEAILKEINNLFDSAWLEKFRDEIDAKIMSSDLSQEEKCILHNKLFCRVFDLTDRS